MNQRHWSVWFESAPGVLSSLSVFADTIGEAIDKALAAGPWYTREQVVAAGWYDATFVDELAIRCEPVLFPRS